MDGHPDWAVGPMITAVDALAVGELLARDLRVPEYQRPYRWRAETAQALLDDCWRAWHAQPGHIYALGSVILYQRPGDGGYDIVDGQQRLLTLRMLLSLLDGVPVLKVDAPLAEDPPQIVRTFQHLRQALALTVPAEERAGFATFIQERCVLVHIVTDEEDEAFRFFDAQNYRGKPLKPHDLLKAHHLRALGSVRPELRATIVEEWESVDDDELEHLFSRYLYRIARWSRGRRAERELGVADIGLFKGIPGEPRTPAESYHFGAQRSDASALGAVAFIPAVRRLLDPGALRSRFQLDAPIIAGSEFFARVSFMLEEQRAIQCLLENSARVRFTKAPRYRYVSELFLAAALYWTNKFFRGS
ncbi:MAG TPA: DUF262 domain-containing protein, partial [Polyangiaceae bacterium]|nr:DUF262 domain-containing protein [Polyangiaceae bacterium]